MTIVIMLRDGSEVRVKCKNFTIKRNSFGEFIGYEYEGCSENHIEYIDVSQILCIYRVMSDEKED